MPFIIEYKYYNPEVPNYAEPKRVLLISEEHRGVKIYNSRWLCQHECNKINLRNESMLLKPTTHKIVNEKLLVYEIPNHRSK